MPKTAPPAVGPAAFAFSAIAVLGALAPLAHAQNDTTAYTACLEKAASVTADALDCMAQELKVQDSRLNQALHQYLEGLGQARQTQFRQVQTLWQQYRDAQCHFYLSPDGGSQARLTASECLLSETAQRVELLRALIQEQELAPDSERQPEAHPATQAAAEPAKN